MCGQLCTWMPIIIESKGENTENLTLTLTKSHTWQKIASQLHMYSCNLLVNQLHIIMLNI